MLISNKKRSIINTNTSAPLLGPIGNSNSIYRSIIRNFRMVRLVEEPFLQSKIAMCVRSFKWVLFSFI